MKKMLTVLLAAAMMLAAAGCSEDSSETELKEVPKVSTVSEKYDPSAINTDMLARAGEILLPTGEKGEVLFSTESRVEYVENKVKMMVREIYEQGGMLVVKVEAKNGYDKTITSLKNVRFKLYDKNKNLFAQYTFEELRDENGKTVKLRPEQNVDAMLVFPAGSYTTKGIDFDSISWHYSSDKSSGDTTTSKTDSSSPDEQTTSDTTASLPSAVRLPSGAKGKTLFSAESEFKQIKDKLEFEVTEVYRQGDDLVVLAEVRNGYSFAVTRIYAVDFDIKDKNGKEIANYSFYELRDKNGKRVTLEPSATADVMLVYPQGKYDLTDANFDHLNWHYSYSYRKQK